MAHHTAFQSPIAALALDPLDPLFFRDGRPFGVGSHRGVSGLPTPRTLAGMVRWQLMQRAGADPRQVRERQHWLSRLAVRGPWLATFNPTKNEVCDLFVPPPAHLMRLGKDENASLVLLAPLERPLPGWRQANPYADQPALAAPWAGWQNEPLRPLERVLLGKEAFQAVLDGRLPDQKTLKKESDLFVSEDRVGVGIDADRQAAADQLLYSLRLIRLREHTVFYAELGVEGDDPAAREQLARLLDEHPELAAPFGGEGRRVAVRRLTAPFAWPRAATDSPADPADGGFASLLLAPACFAAREDAEATARLVPPQPLGILTAMALGRPTAESGWHLAGLGPAGHAGRAAGVPRPTRHLVPAGSVYFWRRGRNASPEAAGPADWHQLAQRPPDRAAGYGLALTARWRWWREA